MNRFHTKCSLLALGIAGGGFGLPAVARETKEPLRTRVVLGPQLVPSYPGSDRVNVRPLVDVSRARGDAAFEFEAPDESAGFPVFSKDGFAAGPALGFGNNRTSEDVGAPLRRVGVSFEVGGFVQYNLAEPFRVRAEVRKGLGGHRGWIGEVSADYIVRDRDEWLFSIGPRVTFADDRHHRAYFSVTPNEAAASGLPRFDADRGVQAVGVTAGYLRQLTRRWGIYSYARYDRLVADPARSPIVRAFGSRNQLSGGLALSYTFGRGS